MIWRIKRQVLAGAVLILVCFLGAFGGRGHFRSAVGSASLIDQMKDQAGEGERAAQLAAVEKKPSEHQPDRDIRALVEACSGGLLRFDDKALSPSYVSGDFDGDGTRDLFVAVRLVGTVSKTDESVPPFNLQFVFGAGPLPEGRAYYNLRMKTLGLGHQAPLFLVLHSFEKYVASKCPSPQTKTVLLFTLDKGTTAMKVFHGRKLPAGTIGDPNEDQPAPQLTGDAILLLNSRGEGSAIYWDGTRFRWYPYN